MLSSSGTAVGHRPWSGSSGGHAFEEELAGLSLMTEDEKDEKALLESPVSPRTIKRPTNPVATCLETWTRKGSLQDAPTQSEREFVKRQRRTSSGSAVRSGLSSLPSGRGVLSPPPGHSDTRAIHLHDLGGSVTGSRIGSTTPSNAPSAQASPVHNSSCDFSRRQPAHEGLAEPLPVFAAGVDDQTSAPQPPAAHVRSRGLAFGTASSLGYRAPRERVFVGLNQTLTKLPSPRQMSEAPHLFPASHPQPSPPQHSAAHGEAAAHDQTASAMAVVATTSTPTPSGVPTPTPLECCSPVALATSCISQNLRLGPPLGGAAPHDATGDAAGLLPPSLIGGAAALPALCAQQPSPRFPAGAPPPPRQQAVTGHGSGGGGGLVGAPPALFGGVATPLPPALGTAAPPSRMGGGIGGAIGGAMGGAMGGGHHQWGLPMAMGEQPSIFGASPMAVTQPLGAFFGSGA